MVAHVRAADDLPTGRVLVMVDHRGREADVVYPGTSATLHPDDLDPAWFRGLDAFHLTGYSLLREGPRAAALRALELARSESRASCTLDPNPSHLIVDYGVGKYQNLLRELQFDVIFPNVEEGRLLSGEDEPDRIAVSLLASSPLVVLTLGADGCMVAERGKAGVARFPSAFIEQARDTTGAGDAFAAAFVVEYLAGRDWHSAAQKANRARRKWSLALERVRACYELFISKRTVIECQRPKKQLMHM